jgi:hypothetical protein
MNKIILFVTTAIPKYCNFAMISWLFLYYKIQKAAFVQYIYSKLKSR